MLLRDARREDLPAIDAIYDHYVATSGCTYQLEPAGLAARVAWFDAHGPRHPVIVAVDDRGGVDGWAALSPFNLRAGYARTVEDSVYVRHDRRGAGLGRALLVELLDRAAALDHHAIIAGIDAMQPASLALHERLGFREVGRLREVGFKLGAFRDVVYLERLFASRPTDRGAGIPPPRPSCSTSPRSEVVANSSNIDRWELAGWDATETAERIARGDVSAREVVDAAIARAEDVAALNALVTATPEQARATAAGAPRGPLFGVPFAVKDLAQVAGVRTAWGTAASGHFVSRRSDPTVIGLLRTGLVSIGKSATPELGMTGTTEPLAFGPARNPWDRARSTGGSSGGAGALVASGVVPIAHGSDGGGSIRIPASCCGLVGLKPSRGRLDMEGSRLLPVNIAVHGVLTRTVRDTVAFWRAIERELPARGLAPIGDVAPAPARRLRLGVYVESPVGTAVDPEVSSVVDRAAALAGELGHDVRRIACPFPAEVVHDFTKLWCFVGWLQAKTGRVLVHRGFDASKLEPFTRGFGRAFGDDIGAALAAVRRLRGFTRHYADLVAPYDVLVGPTLAEPPPLLGHLATDRDFDETLARLLAYTPFTGLFNAAGAPAISLPLGRTARGLPVGVHFAGAIGAERTLLELAGELERAAPWTKLAPRL